MNIVKQAWSVVRNPEQGFVELQKQSFEQSLGSYVQLVLLSGICAAIVSFLYAIGNAAYLNIFKSVKIDYLNLLNYYAGIAVGVFFLYLFIGTFIVFLVSIIVKSFVKMKYTEVLRALCFSLSPVLLFGWISQKLAIALLIWSVVLAVVGLQTKPVQQKITRSSRAK